MKRVRGPSKFPPAHIPPGLPSGEYDRRILQKLIQRILIQPTGCWEWQAFRHKKGYGLTAYRSGNIAAHRLAYKLMVGPIPDGHLICHKCDNPPCCNPAHLYTGTMVDNAQDSADKMRHFNGRKTHCKHGHEFTPENTMTRPVKDRPGLFRRQCLECDRLHHIGVWGKRTPEQKARLYAKRLERRRQKSQSGSAVSERGDSGG